MRITSSSILLLYFLVFHLLKGEDWSRWRGAMGDGSWKGPLISKELPKDGLKRIWKTKVYSGYSGVTVFENRVYLMDKKSDSDGKDHERIVCLSAQSGKVLWQYSYPVDYKDMGYGKGPRASVLIHNEQVFSFGVRGTAISLDAYSGKMKWMRNLILEENATLPIWGFSSTPEPFGEYVLYHAGCQPEGSILALSQNTGKTIWKVGRDDKAGYAPPLLISEGEKKQLICWGPNKIMGLSVDGRNTIWEIPYAVKYGVSITKPIFHESIILVSGYWHGTRAIKLSDTWQNAQILWSDESQIRGLMSQALYRDGTCFLLDRTNGLTAFELKSGKIYWQDNHSLTAADRNPQASLVWVNQEIGDALALNAEGELVFLNLQSGQFREYWRDQAVAQTWSHPAYSERFVYARDDQSVVCYELPID